MVMKNATRIFVLILLAITMTVGLNSCHVYVKSDDPIVDRITQYSWENTTEYSDCTIYRRFIFNLSGTGHYYEKIDYYDQSGQYVRSVYNSLNMTWDEDDSSNIAVYLSDNTNIYLDNISFIGSTMQVWINNENLSFEPYY